MPNASVNVAVEMTKSFCSIFFRVVDKSGQTPIVGAKVEMQTMAGEPINEYLTDSEGKATFTDMPATMQFKWICTAKGYQNVEGTIVTI